MSCMFKLRFGVNLLLALLNDSRPRTTLRSRAAAHVVRPALAGPAGRRPRGEEEEGYRGGRPREGVNAAGVLVLVRGGAMEGQWEKIREEEDSKGSVVIFHGRSARGGGSPRHQNGNFIALFV